MILSICVTYDICYHPITYIFLWRFARSKNRQNLFEFISSVVCGLLFASASIFLYRNRRSSQDRRTGSWQNLVGPVEIPDTVSKFLVSCCIFYFHMYNFSSTLLFSIISGKLSLLSPTQFSLLFQISHSYPIS